MGPAIVFGLAVQSEVNEDHLKEIFGNYGKAQVLWARHQNKKVCSACMGVMTSMFHVVQLCSIYISGPLSRCGTFYYHPLFNPVLKTQRVCPVAR